MSNLITGATIFISILVIILILMQGGGGGLGSAWGGGGGTYQTKRGIEKWLMRLTIFAIVLFFLISFVNLSI